jgi:hypothetical protein
MNLAVAFKPRTAIPEEDFVASAATEFNPSKYHARQAGIVSNRGWD